MKKDEGSKKETIIWYRSQRMFVRRFLPAFIPILYIIYFTYNMYAQDKARLVEDSEKRQMRLVQHLVSREILSVRNDLEILSKHPGIEEYLSRQTEESKTALVEAFVALSQVKKTYDQIRFFDANGMEKIRVDLDQEKPFVVPDDELQPQGHHHYFADTFSLSRNQVFISPFDLNIEHDEVELPPKPMIRFGIPLYGKDGTKQGAIIINYLGEHLLGKLDLVPDLQGQSHMLLNSQSYWLKGETAKDEWGFMFEDRKDAMYRNRFPSAWQEISSYVSGQFYSGSGLVTFYTIYPLREIALSGGEAEQDPRLLEGEANAWKIVSHIDKDCLEQNALKAQTPFLILAITFILVLALLVKKENERPTGTDPGEMSPER